MTKRANFDVKSDSPFLHDPFLDEFAWQPVLVRSKAKDSPKLMILSRDPAYLFAIDDLWQASAVVGGMTRYGDLFLGSFHAGASVADASEWFYRANIGPEPSAAMVVTRIRL